MISKEKTSLPTVYPFGTNHSERIVADLAKLAYEARMQVLNMVYKHQTGHIGGAFSIAEFLVALFFHHLSLDPQNPAWPERDRLLFSKGHACAMLYTCLAYRGFFPIALLDTFRELDSKLQGHPERTLVPGIEIPAGPLGHGVAIGAGMALNAKLEGSKRKIYTILGDGEINAGLVWEGALIAAKNKLDNLTVILDYNGVQQTGTTNEVLPTGPIADKWRSFGWEVIETNGHNMRSVLDTLDLADEIHLYPKIIIARTTKGKGISFMEMEPYWHGSSPSEQQYQAGMKELQTEVEKWNQ